MFGEKVPQTSVIELVRSLRAKNAKLPVFCLTKTSEAKLTPELERAGVDDMMNVAEMRTPLFAWTFQSLLEQVEMRKKAKDYDILRNRLKNIDESLGNLMHKINNPLSIVRLTLYHLDDPGLPQEKRDIFLKMMIESVRKIDTHINELRSIRRQLGEDTTIIAKILAMKAVRQVVASR
jgi:signal transduction histidine kinase